MLDIAAIAKDSKNRLELWKRVAAAMPAQHVCEVGVWRGEFAEKLLKQPCIRRYHMIDPWQHLGDWNKPFNKSDDTFA